MLLNLPSDCYTHILTYLSVNEMIDSDFTITSDFITAKLRYFLGIPELSPDQMVDATSVLLIIDQSCIINTAYVESIVQASLKVKLMLYPSLLLHIPEFHLDYLIGLEGGNPTTGLDVLIELQPSLISKVEWSDVMFVNWDMMARYINEITVIPEYVTELALSREINKAKLLLCRLVSPPNHARYNINGNMKTSPAFHSMVEVLSHIPEFYEILHRCIELVEHGLQNT